jgi:WD40 repeat protein
VDELELDEPDRHIRQYAQAAESAVVIQVGGDLHISDGGLWLIERMRAPRLGTAGECPYPGLREFGFDQAYLFFGREKVTGELLRHLDEMTLGGGGPLLVVGPSGAGKSSLLGAGLLGEVARGGLRGPGSQSWPWVLLRPGSHPAQALRDAVARASDGRELGTESRTIVVIDQLEEIFTACDSEAERAQFLDEVARLAADTRPGSALVVLGLRADFYSQATGYPVLHEAMQKRQVVLGAMSAKEVRQAITSPAYEVSLQLEPGLADLMLRDLNVEGGTGPRSAGGYEAGQLPLLAHALRATWELSDRHHMTIANYKATKGIGGSIARAAEDAYRQLDAAGQDTARQVFLNLIRVGEAAADGDATADTRRRVATDSLLQRMADPAAAEATLATFTTARLLLRGEKSVEITHEALLSRWPRLREWIDADRASLILRQQVEDAAAAWDKDGRDAGGLLGGTRLAAVQAYAADPARRAELSPAGREFIDRSESRRKRGIRIRNAVIAVLAALSLVLAGLSVFARAQQDAAQANFEHAEAGLLAAQSGQAWGDFAPDTAQEFATEAYRLYPSPQVRDALLATQTLPITGRLLTANEQPEGSSILSVAFNPAGTLIAGTTKDDYVQLWNASTYRLLWRFPFPAIDGDHEPANDVVFSPDGKTMAVTQPDSTWLFNLADPARPVHVATLHVPPIAGSQYPQVTRLAFSPDGQTIAAAISTSSQPVSVGEVLLWNASTGALAGKIPETYLTDNLSFTPDGQSLVTGTANSAVDVWNIARRVKTAQLQAPDGTGIAGEDAVAVSPNGQLIAFAARTPQFTDVIKLWSVAAGKVIRTIPAGSNGVSDVAFSPNGTQLAAGDFFGTVQRWDISVTPALSLGTLSGHRFPIRRIAFSPDGATLASASDDGSIALWSTRGAFLGGLANPSISLAFSPDGRTLALSTQGPAGYDVALYAMPARRLIRTLPIGAIASVAFSPDGKTLAVAPSDPALGPVSLWNVATGELTGTMRTRFTPVGNESYAPINSIAFSPDGRLLAVSSTLATTIEVWSTATRTQVASFGDNQDTPFAQALGGVYQLAFSPDGRLLATAGIDGWIRVYSVPGFSLAGDFPGLGTSATLAFSPDGRLLAVGNSTGDVFLFTVPTTAEGLQQLGYPTQLGTFIGSGKTIWSVQFQSDDTLIAAGQDGNVRFWTVPAHASHSHLFHVTIPAETIATHAGLVSATAYSAPLGLVVTGAISGTRVWETNPGQVATSICQSLRAPVARGQWADYLPGIPYTPVCG